MSNYIGIDLGTTNSVICCYDGKNTRIYKSPQEQNDVTPSAIYFDKRTKYVGSRAYAQLAQRPNNVAYLFKRFLGSATKIQVPAMGLELSPIECSAEILRTLYNYLPSEIRDDENSGTVITVPAAFNQMQKDATLQAAKEAGLGQVAILQEPVAAVMSVMKVDSNDGKFLIYDLGGGTLDITLAECINHRVQLLKTGGIQMFGGRDFDNLIVKEIVVPWLEENFDLPDWDSPDGKKLLRVAAYAAEKAKINLSAQNSSKIVANEDEIRICDLSGEEIYFDIPVTQDAVNDLIFDMVDKSVEEAHEVIETAGLTNNDIEKIVFVGGPTNYEPLRERVSIGLAIPACIDVNPMTAVAEGASIYAESIEWNSADRAKKNTREQLGSDGKAGVTFNYVSRTPDIKAKIAAIVSNNSNAVTVQIDSIDTGWTSGKIALKKGLIIDLPLSKQGENTFKVYVFDSVGSPIKLKDEKIIITRTTATIEAIPASYSTGIEALEKVGGPHKLIYLVKQGEQLPVSGQKVFRAAEALKAGDSKSINFKLWEGEIKNPITDNRPIGTLKISGSDFDSGMIDIGTEIVCDYEVSDSGNIRLNIKIPSMQLSFGEKSFYSRQEGERDFADAYDEVHDNAETALENIRELNETINDSKLDEAEEILENIIIDMDEADPESIAHGFEKILAAKKLLAKVSEDHLAETRQYQLNKEVSLFEDCKKYAKQSEITAYDNLVASAQRSIDNNTTEFEILLNDLGSKRFAVLWRQDWYVIQVFKDITTRPGIIVDRAEFNRVCQLGENYIQSGNIDGLRGLFSDLFATLGNTNTDYDSSIANIIVG